MNIKIKDIIKICKAKLLFGNDEIICENFSKDTRTIQTGDVYVGIKGENFDGNTLYKEAFEKGASVCILQNVDVDIEEISQIHKDKCIIMVEDTIKALQEIATYKRSLYNIPVIAITGSVGKTSTKDIIASVVSTKYNVLKTQGNMNNHIGLPMTILGLKNHEALVVEMGMNNLGEISDLSKIAKPNIAVITNVGTAHIGNLGSRENILKAKLEILDGMNDNGVLIINNDNDLLNAWAKNYKGNIKIITYGINEENSDVKSSNIELYEDKSIFDVTVNNESSMVSQINKVIESELIENKVVESKFQINNISKITEKITVPIGGVHFVYNAMCSVAVGEILNIDFSKIKEGIDKFSLSKNRMELINLSNDVLLINDCYNANYDSMKAGIEYLAKTKAEKKIAILGDMLELGEFSDELHRKVGEEVIKNDIDILITVGEKARIISDTVKTVNSNVYACESNQEAVAIAKSLMKKDDIIYIKASNGMRFKEIVDSLKEC